MDYNKILNQHDTNIFHKMENRVDISLSELEYLKSKIAEQEEAIKNYDNILKQDARYIIVKDFYGALHSVYSSYNNEEVIFKLPEEFIKDMIFHLEPQLSLSKSITDFGKLPWYKKFFYNFSLECEKVNKVYQERNNKK